MAYIYKITNDINNKVYIGKTERSIEKRFREHCSDAFRERNEKRPLYSAMRKYGVEHFRVEQLEETNNPEEREIYWIEQYDSYSKGYNATLGGDGKHYLDYDKIIEEYSKYHNQKLVAEKLNIDVHTVHKVLISNHIDIIIPSNENCKKVQMSSRSDGTVKTFSSCGEAARFLIQQEITSAKVGTVTSKITDCCNGRRKSAYDCLWEFIGV